MARPARSADAVIVLDGPPARWPARLARRPAPYSVVAAVPEGDTAAAASLAGSLATDDEACAGVALVVAESDRPATDTAIAALSATAARRVESFVAQAGALAWAHGRVDAMTLSHPAGRDT